MNILDKLIFYFLLNTYFTQGINKNDIFTNNERWLTWLSSSFHIILMDITKCFAFCIVKKNNQRTLKEVVPSSKRFSLCENNRKEEIKKNKKTKKSYPERLLALHDVDGFWGVPSLSLFILPSLTSNNDNCVYTVAQQSLFSLPPFLLSTYILFL